MPYSNKIFVPVVSNVLAYLQPKAFFDIGAGAGKFGKLVRRVSPTTKTTALEMAQEYIDQFGLASIYNEVRCANAESLFAEVDATYDVVMLGDVIEHLRKSVGVDLLHFLVYRSRLMIIIYPTERLQNSVHGHDQEAHISVWIQDDFKHFDYLYLGKDNRFNFVLVRGYHMPVSEFDHLKKRVYANLPSDLKPRNRFLSRFSKPRPSAVPANETSTES